MREVGLSIGACSETDFASGTAAIVDEKKALRRQLKAKEREFLAAGLAAKESERILSALASLDAFRSASCILLYMAMPGEVLTQDFVRWCSEAGKRVVLPKVVVGDRAAKGRLDCGLELREYAPEKLVTGYRGIEEPSDDARLVDPSDIDLAIIPGLAFCPISSYHLCEEKKSVIARRTPVRRGNLHLQVNASSLRGGRQSDAAISNAYYRLGRGGGYYDRLLPRLNCPTIGVCFPFRVVDKIPIEAWDIPVDELLY